VHAEGRGVVDDDGTGLADLLGPFARHSAAGAHQHQVDAREVELLDVLALDGAVAEGDLDAFGFSRGDRVHFLDGEVHFLEDGQDFPADIACGAYDGDAIAHDEIILCSGAFGRNASAFGSFAAAKQPESSNLAPESANAFP